MLVYLYNTHLFYATLDTNLFTGVYGRLPPPPHKAHFYIQTGERGNVERTAPHAVWTGLKDHQQWHHVCSNDCPWDDLSSTSFCRHAWCNLMTIWWEKPTTKLCVFFSLHVLYALLLPDLYFWLKLCVLYSNFYGSKDLTHNAMFIIFQYLLNFSSSKWVRIGQFRQFIVLFCIRHYLYRQHLWNVNIQYAINN